MDAMHRLIEIMARLRDPQSGCPWDIKQTFASIAPYTLEEAYEVTDAIEHGDLDELRGELGDLLFQVVFHARMAEEQGAFGFDDVAQAICDKMIRRHPHVFGDADFADEAELRQAWEAAKQAERGHKQQDDSALAGVARALPALVRADKLQKRAARVGFDWDDASGAWDKVREEIAEVQQAREVADQDHLEEELGDLLFAVVNVTRLLGVDAEHALRRANHKFEARFRRMETYLAAQGQADLSRLDLASLDAAWEAIKATERRGTDD
jgi:MazG family protein